MGWSMGILVLGLLGLIAIAGIFALIFWLLGRSSDDESP
jgi:hypothetical protein